MRSSSLIKLSLSLFLVLLATPPAQAAARRSISRSTRGAHHHHHHQDTRMVSPESTTEMEMETAAERLLRSGITSGACADNWRPGREVGGGVPGVRGVRRRTSGVRGVRRTSGGRGASGKEGGGKGCWKDTWFEQLSRVLDESEEEEEGEEWFGKLSWSNQLNAQNHATLTHLLTCLPYFSLPHAVPNDHGCHNNALTVILAANWWVDITLLGVGESGEVVWLRTMVETLQEEGYSFLSVAHHNYAGLIKLYSAIPDIINTIWASEAVIISCMSDPFCRFDFPRAQAHALGMADVRGVIPSWKMMAVSYWGAHPTSWEYGQREGDGFAFNPLGHEWALVPFPYPGHTHIPMSLEKQCNATPFIPHHNRKDTAVILGKLTPYFFPNRSGDLPPSLEAWQGFLRETGLQAIGNAKPLFPGVEGEPQGTPEGVLNRGPVGRDEFTKEVGQARMIIGIGMPAISPSPYLALCQGVPALIPYDGNDPTPPGFELYSLGRTQHGPAASLGEPYVYSYNRHDVQSLYAAARKARANPIKPFIPDEMRHVHVARLTLQAVNRDYHALAREIERQRLHKGGEDAVYAAIPDHVRETVFGHGWGMRMMRDGTVGKTL